MTVSKYQFRVELQRLIAKYITPSSSFEDYVLITEQLEEVKDRLDWETEKFSEDEVNSCEL
ncbi:hypothetical protein QA639_21400 [Bradyrhizobium pachyrhizi]|uniref:hypothetical protein n=1 Tax=Bradyrhizobium pachyrhizi TaxID=280333 RepID=UPI0024B16B00|nr:hypothetical protein [Bradyrhizobium pachyrhizi]WFU52267.1 hypothetical protein QA639_21400 [Bradyrhizobium pachyrhizi]